MSRRISWVWLNNFEGQVWADFFFFKLSHKQNIILLYMLEQMETADMPSAVLTSFADLRNLVRVVVFW